MSAHLYQIATMVVLCKNALRSNMPLETPLANHIDIKEIKDIQLLFPHIIEDKNLLGFSNTEEICILCFLEKGEILCLVPDWTFDHQQNRWVLHFTEYKYPDTGMEKKHYSNNIIPFKNILSDIKNFALEIEYDSFAAIFDSAASILDGTEVASYDSFALNQLPLPAQNLQLFKAAQCADVFGAMGSWNDSPAYTSHSMGLDEKYDLLSNELMKNIRLALLYAVNEW